MAEITFSLEAPYNKEACLLADFTDWQRQPLSKDEDGVFRANFELADGTYYYRFAVQSLSWFNEPDAWVEVIDPFATALNEAEDAAMITIQDGQAVLAPYDWPDDATEQVPLQTMVFYELHVGRFGAEQGNAFRSLTEKLDYLQDLGVNTIQMMPVQEFPGKISLGYNPSFFLAPEAAYGSPLELKQFINQAHGKQMRVFGDMIFNHAGTECPLTQIDHDYWFLHEAKDPENSWGPEFNYDKYDEAHDRHPAWEFVARVVNHWLMEYHLDGIRYDAVRQIDHSEFLNWVTKKAHSMSGNKPFLNIAECIPDNPDLCASGTMDMSWHDSFCHTVRELLRDGQVDNERFKDALDGQRRGYASALQMLNYISNHDQPRLLLVLQEAGHSDEMAFQRYQLACLILFVANGIPMVRMGDEFGLIEGEPDPSKDLPFDALESENGQMLFHLHQQLIQWRLQLPALQTGQIEWLWEDGNRVAFIRSEPTTEIPSRVLVVLNPSDEALELPLELPGKWQGLLNANDAENVIPIQLAPWQGGLWLQL